VVVDALRRLLRVPLTGTTTSTALGLPRLRTGSSGLRTPALGRREAEWRCGGERLGRSPATVQAFAGLRANRNGVTGPRSCWLSILRDFAGGTVVSPIDAWRTRVANNLAAGCVAAQIVTLVPDDMPTAEGEVRPYDNRVPILCHRNAAPPIAPNHVDALLRPVV
jgi:hypothetical protein